MKTEERRPLNGQEFFVLKALFKLPLTQLQLLACGVCVPTVSWRECVRMASDQAEGEEGRGCQI